LVFSFGEVLVSASAKFAISFGEVKKLRRSFSGFIWFLVSAKFWFSASAKFFFTSPKLEVKKLRRSLSLHQIYSKNSYFLALSKNSMFFFSEKSVFLL